MSCPSRFATWLLPSALGLFTACSLSFDGDILPNETDGPNDPDNGGARPLQTHNYRRSARGGGSGTLRRI